LAFGLTSADEAGKDARGFTGVDPAGELGSGRGEVAEVKHDEQGTFLKSAHTQIEAEGGEGVELVGVEGDFVIDDFDDGVLDIAEGIDEPAHFVGAIGDLALVDAFDSTCADGPDADGVEVGFGTEAFEFFDQGEEARGRHLTNL
jgi:hypothetical protein